MLSIVFVFLIYKYNNIFCITYLPGGSSKVWIALFKTNPWNLNSIINFCEALSLIISYSLEKYEEWKYVYVAQCRTKFTAVFRKGIFMKGY